SFGSTPLHKACFANNLGVVQWLISVGADVTARDSLGGTPLHDAAHSGSKQIVECVLQAYLSSSSSSSSSSPSSFSSSSLDPRKKKSPSSSSIQQSSPELPQDLHKCSPLHFAALSGNAETVDSLAAAFPDSLNQTDSSRRTALF